MKLFSAIAIAELAGIVGAIFTTPNISTWYATLAKPPINPPSWVFGPVWTILYALMGISAYLIWERGYKRKEVRAGLYIFAVQLGLNTLWSILFFGFRNPGLAFVEIIILWLAIIATMATFSKSSRVAAWLLVPYLAWVTFATYLNYSIWILN